MQSNARRCSITLVGMHAAAAASEASTYLPVYTQEDLVAWDNSDLPNRMASMIDGFDEICVRKFVNGGVHKTMKIEKEGDKEEDREKEEDNDKEEDRKKDVRQT